MQMSFHLRIGGLTLGFNLGGERGWGIRRGFRLVQVRAFRSRGYAFY